MIGIDTISKQWSAYDVRYDTRCYFYMLSKADISQLNLLHYRKSFLWNLKKYDKSEDIILVNRAPGAQACSI